MALEFVNFGYILSNVIFNFFFAKSVDESMNIVIVVLVRFGSFFNWFEIFQNFSKNIS